MTRPDNFGSQVVGNVGLAPGHCSGCGAELVRDKKAYGYSTYDGQPKYSYHCPNRRWWNFTAHTQGLA